MVQYSASNNSIEKVLLLKVKFSAPFLEKDNFSLSSAWVLIYSFLLLF